MKVKNSQELRISKIKAIWWECIQYLEQNRHIINSIFIIICT